MEKEYDFFLYQKAVSLTGKKEKEADCASAEAAVQTTEEGDSDTDSVLSEPQHDLATKSSGKAEHVLHRYFVTVKVTVFSFVSAETVCRQ